MNGITINDKQYIFIKLDDDVKYVDCDSCDLKKDGYFLPCDAMCICFHTLIHSYSGYGVFKELKEEK